MNPRVDLSALYEAVRPGVNHLHRQLPYRYFDEQTTLFENTVGYGFGKKLSPLCGANHEVISALNRMVCGLPEGHQWDYQCVLVGNNQVAHLIEQNQRLQSVRGGILAVCAENEALYAKHSARHGFTTRKQATDYYDLKDYNVFFFVSTVAKKAMLLDVKTTLESELSQTSLHHAPITAEDLITHVSEHLNFDPHRDRPTPAPYNALEHLNQQMVTPDSEFLVAKEHVDVRFTGYGQTQATAMRLVSLGLKRLPSEMRLYQIPNLLASLVTPEKALRCPHRISVNFRINPTAKEITRNEGKLRSLTKIVHSPMRLFAPFAGDELHERQDLQRGMNSQEFKIAGLVMTLTLYSDEANVKTDVTKALSTFQSAGSEGGLDMCVTKLMQAQSLLATLPFQMTTGLWDDCRKAGRVRTVKTSNLVNFLPVVAERKNYSGGLLLPTMRHQVSYFDPFHCGSDNFNIALTGTSGSGKSFFVQSLVKSIYARQGKVWILDKGASYKKLTQTLGGVYMTAGQIFLNPFTHLTAVKDCYHQDAIGASDSAITPLRAVLGDIVELLATMAAPNEALAPYQMALLGDAVIHAWEVHGNKTLIDHVQAALMTLASERDGDRRLTDLADQLNKYTTQGLYGDIFNKPSQLNPTIDITTLELDGFANAILRPVVFALMVSINQQMYLAGSRTLPKLCVIEEAWSLMSSTNQQSRGFIEQGYRTARKFGGGFCTVTQGIEDFFASDAAKGAFNNADIHITLRQGKGFKKFLKENPEHFTPFEARLIQAFPTAQLAGYSCCMLSVGGVTSFHRIYADPWTRALLSTEASEYEYCERLIQRGVPLSEAVTLTARHFYPDEMAAFEHIKATAMTEITHCAA